MARASLQVLVSHWEGWLCCHEAVVAQSSQQVHQFSRQWVGCSPRFVPMVHLSFDPGVTSDGTRVKLLVYPVVFDSSQQSHVVAEAYTRPTSDVLCHHTSCFAARWPTRRIGLVDQFFAGVLTGVATREGKSLCQVPPVSRDVGFQVP